MKRIISVAAICLTSLTAFALTPYTEVDIKMLKAAPESYSSKKVTFTSTYTRYSTTFLPYMESSGIKPGKYFWLEIGGAGLPVIARKKDEMNTLVAGLKRGTPVKVYGRVKKFKKAPKQPLFSRYYVSVDDIEIVELAPGQDPPDKGVDLPPYGQKRRIRRWRR